MADFNIVPSLLFKDQSATYTGTIISAGEDVKTYFVDGETNTINEHPFSAGYPIVDTKNRTFNNEGLYLVRYIVTDYSDVQLSAFSVSVSANPLPEISFDGSPNTSSTMTFQDDNGSLYYVGTVISADWNFGDGNTSSTIDLTATFDHIYETIGNYNVSVSAYDISGNIGVDTVIIAVLESSNCKPKEDYITICGPEMLGRFGSCRNINLVEYLPLYLRGGETEEFLVLFEEFLNNMFSGLCGWQVTSADIPINQSWSVINSGSSSASVSQDFSYDISGVSAFTNATSVEQLNLGWPSKASYATSAQKISILDRSYYHQPYLCYQIQSFGLLQQFGTLLLIRSFYH
jgi:hypothetical protein